MSTAVFSHEKRIVLAGLFLPLVLMGSNFSNIDVRASIQFVGLWCWRHDINKSACNYLSDFCLIVERVTDRQALLQEHKGCPLSSFFKPWCLRNQENILSHGYRHLKQAQVLSYHRCGTLLTDKTALPLSKPNTTRLLAALIFYVKLLKIVIPVELKYYETQY